MRETCNLPTQSLRAPNRHTVPNRSAPPRDGAPDSPSARFDRMRQNATERYEYSCPPARARTRYDGFVRETAARRAAARLLLASHETFARTEKMLYLAVARA